MIPLIALIFRKPQAHALSDIPMRHHGQFTASPKTMEQLRRRGSVVEQLAIYRATVSPADRKLEADTAFTVLRSVARSVGQGRS